MIDRDDLPPTPEWSNPPRVTAPPAPPAPTIATAELDSRGTE